MRTAIVISPLSAVTMPRHLIPGLFVLLWSSGFIGAKLGLPYAEPMTFLALRFLIVSVVLAIVVLATRAPLPATWRDAGHIAVFGLLVHGVYLGGVFAAIWLGVNAGVSALIVSVQPLLTAVVVGPFLGERVSPRQWIGFLLGFAGVSLVVAQNFSLEGTSLIAFLLNVASLLGITVGLVYQKRFCAGMDLRSGSLIQFAAAAVMMLTLAEGLETNRVDWHPRFVFALAWLCLVLSLGAITLLLVLVRRGEASRTASLFYLVPAVTAILAWLIFDERLAMWSIVGMALSVVGVAVVLRGAKPP